MENSQRNFSQCLLSHQTASLLLAIPFVRILCSNVLLHYVILKTKVFKGALCAVVEFRQCTGLESGPWLSGKHRMWVKNVPDQSVVVPQGWWLLLWNWLPQSCKTRDWSVTFNHRLTRHIPSLVGKNQLLEVSSNCKMKLVTKRYVA